MKIIYNEELLMISNKQIILMLRHGEYENKKYSDSILSALGKEKIFAVERAFNNYLIDLYGLDAKRVGVGIGLSDYFVVTRSMHYLCNHRSYKIIWPGPLLSDRSTITAGHAKEVYRIIQKWLAYNQVNIAIVVAHGDMPAVLFEYIIKNTDFAIDCNVVNTKEAEGYLINFEKREMFFISSRGLVSFIGQSHWL